MKLRKKQRVEAKRIAEYLISGGAYFWSGYAVFFVLDSWLGFSLWWAKLLANITGWIVNYVLQRYWVFNNKALKGHEQQVTHRYIGLTLFNFVLDYLIVAGLKNVGISPYIGQFISSGFFTVWNYLWYKLYVFYQPKRTRVKPKVVHVTHKLAHKKYHNHPGYARKKVVKV